jgi:hypothetical protein
VSLKQNEKKKKHNTLNLIVTLWGETLKGPRNTAIMNFFPDAYATSENVTKRER